MMHIKTLFVQAASVYISHPVHFVLVALVGLPPGVALVFVNIQWYWPVFLVDFAIAVIVYGALVHSTAVMLKGAEPTFSRSYQLIFGRLRQLLGVTIRYVGAILLLTATIVGIPIAVYLFVRWFFGVHAVVLDNLSAGEALSLSSRLVRGMWWRVFGTVVLVGSLVVGLMTWAPIIISGSFSTEALLVSNLLIVTVAPFVVCVHTLLFLELQNRLDLASRQQPAVVMSEFATE